MKNAPKCKGGFERTSFMGYVYLYCHEVFIKVKCTRKGAFMNGAARVY